jgi:hypothetical protein
LDFQEECDKNEVLTAKVEQFKKHRARQKAAQQQAQ